MIFKADITLMPTKSKNAEGKKVLQDLKKMHINQVTEVHVGRHYVMYVEANSKNAASAFVDEACKCLIEEGGSETLEFTVKEM